MITFFVVSLVPPFSTHCHLFRVFPSGLISPDGSRNQKTWPSIVNNICCIKASESLNKSIARWDDRLDSLESIGPHDHVMRLSLVEYSTPSPCTKIAGLITLLSRDRGGANLGSLECSTFFQKDAASWKQKNLAKVSGWCSASWLNIRCGRKIEASSLTIFLLLVSSTSTVTLIGSLMRMFLQKFVTKSLWQFPLLWPKLPHFASKWAMKPF